jgi:hypothetical protein
MTLTLNPQIVAGFLLLGVGIALLTLAVFL